VAVARDSQVQGDVLRTDVRLASVTGHLQNRVRRVERAGDIEHSVTLDRYVLGSVAGLEQGQALIDTVGRRADLDVAARVACKVESRRGGRGGVKEQPGGGGCGGH